MDIKKQDIVDIVNILITNERFKIISKEFEYFDYDGDGYIDLFDLIEAINEYSAINKLSKLQENKIKDFTSNQYSISLE